MFKKFSFALVIVAATAGMAHAAVTVRYHNSDSAKHVFAAKCSGSAAELKVDGNTTSSATIQGSGPCKVTHAGGVVELKGGEQLEIKDGKISVK